MKSFSKGFNFRLSICLKQFVNDFSLFDIYLLVNKFHVLLVFSFFRMNSSHSIRNRTLLTTPYIIS